MRGVLGLATVGFAALAWAGEAEEPAAGDPPPPPGMHRLSEPEAAAKVDSARGLAAIFVTPATEGAQRDAVSLQASLEAALESRGVKMVDLDVLFPPAPLESLAQGEALFKQGRDAYDNLDVESAADKFNRAIAFYNKHPLETEPPNLARAYVFLGAALALNNDAARAKEAFQNALLADPHAKPDSELFGKDVQRAFEVARGALVDRPTGTLHVNSVPPGARVWVRGELKGTTPLTPLALVTGKHKLVIRRPGYLPFGAFAEVGPARTTEIEAALEPTGGLAAMQASAAKLSQPASFKAGELPGEAKALGERLGARYLVLVASRGAVGELQAWDLLSGNKLKGLTLGAGGRRPEQAAEQVKAWIDHPPGPGFSAYVPGVMKQWWFWAGAGAVALIAGGSVAVASSGHPHYLFPGGVP